MSMSEVENTAAREGSRPLGETLRRLPGRISLATLTWVLLMLVIPQSVGRDESISLVARATSLPGLLELSLTLLATVLALRAVWRAPHGFLRKLQWPGLAALAGYFLLALLTAVFSPYRLRALAYSGQGLILLSLTVVVFSGRRVDRSPFRLAPLYAGAAIAIALAAGAWVLVPEAVWSVSLSTEQRLSGIGLHPNQLGFLGAVTGLGASWAWLRAEDLRARLLPTLLLVLAGVVLVATRGRADLLGFALGLLILLVFGGTWKWLIGLLVAAGGMLALAPRWSLQALTFLNRGFRLATLRSRMALWDYLIQRAISSPGRLALGEGIGSSAAAARGAGLSWATPAHSHNFLVEALQNVGVLGVLLALVSMAAVGAAAIKSAGGDRSKASGSSPENLALFALLLVVSTFEASFTGRPNVYTFGYFALSAAVAARVSGQPGSLKASSDGP